jgi:hypothetical protein
MTVRVRAQVNSQILGRWRNAGLAGTVAIRSVQQLFKRMTLLFQ